MVKTNKKKVEKETTKKQPVKVEKKTTKKKSIFIKDKITQVNTQDYLKAKDLKTLLKKYKDSKYPEKTILVKMKLLNGFWTTFTIQSTDNKFSYLGGAYIIDVDALEYDIDSKLWSLLYHQGISLPLQLVFNVDDLKTDLVNSGKIESTASLNPSILDSFVNSQVIEKLLKAEELTENLKKLQNRIMFCLVGVGICVFILVKNFGAW